MTLLELTHEELSHDPSAAHELILHFFAWSWERYEVDHFPGIEYEVWQLLHAEPDSEFFLRCRDLANRAGGWCAYEISPTGWLFLPMDKWIAHTHFHSASTASSKV